MGEVIPFRKARSNDTLKGRRLCAGGYHRWEVVSRRPADASGGRLLWEYRCSRCGATKTALR